MSPDDCDPLPGTLEGFDLVLAVNEAAVNAQFLHLFTTPISHTDENGAKVYPPPPVSSEPDNVNEDFLIDHRIRIKMDPNSAEDDAVFGYMECPRVDFVNLSRTADKMRTVRVIFKMLNNEPGQEARPELGIPAYHPHYNSYCAYWDIFHLSPKGFPTKTLAPINGHTISFEATIGRADIQQLQQRYLPLKTYEALKPAVESEVFLASSLFCLFESPQIANSFMMHDALGKPIDDRALLQGVMMAFSLKFAQEAPPRAVPGNGLPNPANPFVLGYCISQKIPDPVVGKPVFEPKNYQFSVTASSKPGFSTINYLMLTGDITHKSNVEIKAGRFDQTFFDVINATSVDSQTKAPMYDGIMAISSDLFMKELVGKFIVPTYAPPDITISGTTSKSVTSTGVCDAKEGTYKITNPSKYVKDYTVGDTDYTQTLNSMATLDVSWTCDDFRVNNNLGVEQQRRLFIDVAGRVDINFSSEDKPGGVVRGILTVLTGPGLSDLPGKYTLNFTVNYKDRLIVSSNDKGKWTITKDEKLHSFPAVEDDPDRPGKKRLVLTTTAGQPGVLVKVETKGSYKVVQRLTFGLCSEALQQGILAATEKLVNISFGDLESKINGTFGDLSTRMVMPAGDVLTFTGISVDAKHHIYNLVDYKSFSNGKRTV